MGKSKKRDSGKIIDLSLVIGIFICLIYLAYLNRDLDLDYTGKKDDNKLLYNVVITSSKDTLSIEFKENKYIITKQR